jgi:hypothetical protein
MKTGNISQGSNHLRQAKLTREEKAPNKEQNEPVEEKVDLSVRTSSFCPILLRHTKKCSNCCTAQISATLRTWS